MRKFVQYDYSNKFPQELLQINEELDIIQESLINSFLIKVEEEINKGLIRLGYDTTNIESLKCNTFSKEIGVDLSERYYINGELICIINPIFNPLSR
jgi:hypothetical protein